jgi:lipopolysaccharide/colanic/teichoic acid biosynthesis glycosyltransferase
MSGWRAAVKRLADLVGAAVLGLLTLPLLLVVLAVTKLMDRRAPAVFRQERVGRNGQPFTVYKVRTMVPNAERETGPVLSEDNDPRVTPFGRWLRRFHVDELPQLWNVLRGEMSLVGPRPERPFFMEQFQSEVPGFERRLEAKPGLTGLAQLRNVADIHCPHKKLAYDLEYIEHYGLWLDLRIACETVYGTLIQAWSRPERDGTGADAEAAETPESPETPAEERSSAPGRPAPPVRDGAAAVPPE